MNATDELASRDLTGLPRCIAARKITMRLIVVMMLGAGAPFIATGCAGGNEVAEPAHAEGEASEDASPNPAPARVTGALTDAERLFEGAWQLYDFKSDTDLGTMRIENRGFHADGVHGEYAGYVSIRSETSPAQIDFTIEECEGDYKGTTSTGIYYLEDDGVIVFAGPAPGDPRPEGFTEPNEMWRMRPLDPATEGDGDE